MGRLPSKPDNGCYEPGFGAHNNRFCAHDMEVGRIASVFNPKGARLSAVS
jgi:hypothetical protein